MKKNGWKDGEGWFGQGGGRWCCVANLDGATSSSTTALFYGVGGNKSDEAVLLEYGTIKYGNKGFVIIIQIVGGMAQA